MTIDEAIKRMEELAEEAQKVVDTHYFSDTVSIDEIYCDDTEIIEEQLAGYQKAAEDYSQLAEWLKDYKRLLEQEQCEDCVSRHAVLDNAYAYGNGLEPEGYCVNVEDIQALPPVKPVQNWTPTSERLPKTNEYVGNVAKHYLIQDEFGDMEVAAYTTRGWIPIHTIEAFEYEVVAWMPLPKPYKAEMENEE